MCPIDSTPPDEAPAPGAARRRRQGGSVVTYAVTAFMIVALAIYLGYAFFGDDSGEVPPGAAAPAAGQQP